MSKCPAPTAGATVTKTLEIACKLSHFWLKIPKTPSKWPKYEEKVIFEGGQKFFAPLPPLPKKNEMRGSCPPEAKSETTRLLRRPWKSENDRGNVSAKMFTEMTTMTQRLARWPLNGWPCGWRVNLIYKGDCSYIRKTFHEKFRNIVESPWGRALTHPTKCRLAIMKPHPACWMKDPMINVRRSKGSSPWACFIISRLRDGNRGLVIDTPQPAWYR